MSARPNPGVRSYAGAVLAGLLLIALWYVLASPGKDRAVLPEIGRVPPFSLTTETGANAESSLFDGKVSIVDFIFTSCAGICPMMSGRMAWLQEELKAEPRVQLVSVSVDPATDTPGVLSEYGRRYGAVPGRWVFLTGDREKIYDLTRNGFHLGVDTEGDDAIIHSPKFVLVDGHGSIRGYYDSDSTGAMDALREDAMVLAAELPR